MSKVYIFLADGFEDIEGLMVVDLLRRAGIEIATVSITEETQVTTSHGVILKTDAVFAESDFTDADMLVIPGGMPGTVHLRECAPLCDLLKKQYEQGKWVAAICAAPTVFSELGFLKGRKATSYPSRMDELDCAEKSLDPVVVDGNVITSRGLGTSADFALKIIEVLDSPEKAAKIAEAVVYKK